MQRVECGSLEALAACAGSFLGRLSASDTSATVVGLSGDLGAGKTAFVKALAQHLGITEHITSPTFVLQKTYPTAHGTFSALTHVDAYRLEGGKELERIGWKETLAAPHTLVVVEWPEKVSDAMPKNAPTLHFEWVSDTARAITIPNV